jgi:hypothetical protein
VLQLNETQIELMLIERDLRDLRNRLNPDSEAVWILNTKALPAIAGLVDALIQAGEALDKAQALL